MLSLQKKRSHLGNAIASFVEQFARQSFFGRTQIGIRVRSLFSPLERELVYSDPHNLLTLSFDSEFHLTLLIPGLLCAATWSCNAIALSDTAPQRKQLGEWHQQLSQEFVSGGVELAQEGEAIGSPSWEEKAKAYGSLVAEAIKHGVETVRALLDGWPEHLRWGAIISMEEQSPEAMVELMQIDPNWSNLCVER